jgi:hypothetical protein
MLEKATAPLKEKIEKMKAKLAEKPKNTVPNPYGAAAARVANALSMFVRASEEISPSEKVEAARVPEKITGRSLRTLLSDAVQHATTAKKWIDEFLQLTEQLR